MHFVPNKFFNFSLASCFTLDGRKVHITTGQVKACDIDEARAKIMAKHWPWNPIDEAPVMPHLFVLEVPVDLGFQDMTPGAVYLHDDGTRPARLVKLNHLYKRVAYCNAPDAPPERLSAKHLNLMALPMETKKTLPFPVLLDEYSFYPEAPLPELSIKEPKEAN